ncbi:four helix bundle protein [Mucilaginibacter sp.]|uniref:four helix bundle protein n=1 Tax=Mucilaginibacter sp. TaxID=1882438 RepID=UPI002627C03F|nr:four helix bundle protein [Mucilaginibacter sp.]MDB5030729.1 four helix bundle protein [Mucilaginibacter sp.]
MSNRIEDIEVYNLSEVFAGKVWEITSTWDFFAKDTIGKQLVRSSDSISANIAEGFGRYHFKENKNFCYYSRGSIIETKTWLYKATSRKLIDNETYQSLLQQLETIHLKLNIYIKFIGSIK